MALKDAIRTELVENSLITPYCATQDRHNYPCPMLLDAWQGTDRVFNCRLLGPLRTVIKDNKYHAARHRACFEICGER